MEIDAEQLKEFLIYVLQQSRQMERELLAHKAALLVAEDWGHFDAGVVPSMVEHARKTEWMEKLLRENYDEPLQRFLEQFDIQVANRALFDYLRKWGEIPSSTGTASACTGSGD